MAQGIWKKVFIQESDGSYAWVTCVIKYNGSTIYNARVYLEPNGGNCGLVINDIVKEYLYQTMPSINGGGWENNHLAGYFSYTFYDPDGDEIDSGGETFLYDWSYDADRTAYTAPSDPITGRTDARAPFLTTKFAGSCTIQVNNGSTTTDVTLTGSTSTAGNGVYLPPSGTAWINDGSHKWTMVDGCNRYVLYYVNAYGGWEQFLIEGATKQTDAITSNTFAPYSASDNSDWETKTYQKVLTRSYKMNTGWLTDTQASKMHHLLESPLVYVYDMDEATLHPCNITNSECEWQTYKGNGRKMAQYEIDVKVAYNFERR